MPPDRRRRSPDGRDQGPPTHPRLAGAILMVAVVAVLVALAYASI
jgi:hypothetical protein